MVVLSEQAEANMRKLFAMHGKQFPTEEEIRRALERLLQQIVQHSNDPTASLQYPVTQAFDR